MTAPLLLVRGILPARPDLVGTQHRPGKAEAVPPPLDPHFLLTVGGRDALVGTSGLIEGRGKESPTTAKRRWGLSSRAFACLETFQSLINSRRSCEMRPRLRPNSRATSVVVLPTERDSAMHRFEHQAGTTTRCSPSSPAPIHSAGHPWQRHRAMNMDLAELGPLAPFVCFPCRDRPDGLPKLATDANPPHRHKGDVGRLDVRRCGPFQLPGNTFTIIEEFSQIAVSVKAARADAPGNMASGFGTGEHDRSPCEGE